MHAWFKKINLRRITNSGQLIPEVDGFRFLAIFIVVVYHIFLQCKPQRYLTIHPSIPLAPYLYGRIGVYLFFTISGFILALPFARQNLQAGKRVNLAAYFRRRLTRLEPPYIVAMLLRFPLVLLWKNSAVTFAVWHLLATLFYIHNIVYHMSSTIYPPAWSLEIEIQFYILTPLLTVVFLVRPALLRAALLTVLIFTGSIISTFFIHEDSRLFLTLIEVTQYFFAGFLLCDIYLAQSQPKIHRGVWDILGLAALATILFVPNRLFFMPFLTILLYLAGLNGNLLRRFFANPYVSITGGMCYSIYLTHASVLEGVAILVNRLHLVSMPAGLATLLIFVLGLGSTFLAGAIFYVLLERPCMDPKWPQKLVLRLHGILASRV